MPANPSETKFFNGTELILLSNGRPSHGIGRFCCSKPGNLANWPTEFGKIVRKNCGP